MRTFVIRVLLFFAIIAFIDVLWGKVMNTALATTEKGDWGRRNYIINKTHEDVLIFGSSRAIRHYDPQILTDSLGMSCYNCAEDGSGILFHYPRFKALLQRYSPKIVIYDIIPKYDFLEFGEITSLGMLRPFSTNDSICTFIGEIDNKERLKLKSEFYKYNSSFLEILMQRFSTATQTADRFTYGALDGEMKYDIDDAGKLEGEGIDMIKFSYFEKFIDLCNSHNIKLYITVSPWYKMKESDTYAPISNLCKKKGVAFLNHNFDSTFNYRKEYFHDAAHLNKYGAETFSKVIAHEIKQQYNVGSR